MLTKDDKLVLSGGDIVTSSSTRCSPNPPPGAPDSSGGPGGPPGANYYCASLSQSLALQTALIAALRGFGFNNYGPDPSNPGNFIVCVVR